MSHHVSIHLDAKSSVGFHCEHEDRVSLLLGGIASPTVVYLSGTPEEIRELGERLISEANHQRARILTRQGVGAVA